MKKLNELSEYLNQILEKISLKVCKTFYNKFTYFMKWMTRRLHEKLTMCKTRTSQIFNSNPEQGKFFVVKFFLKWKQNNFFGEFHFKIKGGKFFVVNFYSKWEEGKFFVVKFYSEREQKKFLCWISIQNESKGNILWWNSIQNEKKGNFCGEFLFEARTRKMFCQTKTREIFWDEYQFKIRKREIFCGEFPLKRGQG